MVDSADAVPPRRRATRSVLFAVVKVLVTAGLLGWLLHTMWTRDGIEALLTRLHGLDPAWALGVVLCHFAAVTSGVLRWSVLLEQRGITMSFVRLGRSFLIGRFLGAFTPSTTGLDGYRLWDVGRASGDMVKSGAVIVIEKLIGLVGMATVCMLLLPFGLLDRLGFWGLAVALGMAFVAGLGLFVLSSPNHVQALVVRLPGALRGPLRSRVGRLSEALEGGLGAGALSRALLLGVLSHACLSATFAVSGVALGLPVPFITLLAVGNAIVISVLVPISIGGIGVREGVAVALLASASVSTTDAVALSVLSYLAGQVPALLGGVLLLAGGDRDRPQPALWGAAPAAARIRES